MSLDDFTKFTHENPHQPFFPPEELLRKACAVRCQDPDSLPRIKDILVVGANSFSYGSQDRRPDELSNVEVRMDDKMISSVVFSLYQAGLNLDPDFVVRCRDLRHGHDVLEGPAEKTDLIILANLPLKKSVLKTQFAAVYDPMEPPKAAWTAAHTISSHHSEKNWAEMIHKSGAKMGVSYGGQRELGSSVMVKAGLTTLIQTPVQFQGLAYTASSDFIKAYQAADDILNPASQLGARLQTTAPQSFIQRHVHAPLDQYVRENLHQIFPSKYNIL